MFFLSVEFWGILLSITSVGLWLFTILYLKTNSIRENKTKIKSGELKICTTKHFDEEVLAQLIKQQSDKAIKRIYDTIKTEIRLVTQLMESGQTNSVKNYIENKNGNNSKITSFQALKKKNSSVKTQMRSGYDEAMWLADQGMTIKKIAEKVKIPKGEIEMLIKLRNSQRPNVRKKQSAGEV